MARKIQVPAVGGLRKVIMTGGTDSATIAALQTQLDALQAQINALAVKPPNTQGDGSEAFLAVSGPLQGGGPMVGNVPLSTTGPLVGIMEGEQGEQGEPGIPGQAGARGPAGPPGPPGAQGEDGEDGGPGPPGATGATGPAGPAGPAGGFLFMAGDEGAEGDMGPPGAAGPPGATGATGPTGPTGPQGPQGTSGILFMLGEEGADGEPGPPGGAGATGPAGPQGPAGANQVFPVPGFDGDDGDEGLPGIPGRDSNSITQVRGVTWAGGNAKINVNAMTDVSVIVPEDVTIIRCTVLTKGGTGSMTATVGACPIGSYGSFIDITGGNNVVISSGVTHDDSTLTGWATFVGKGTVINFHLSSTSVFTEIVLQLTFQRTGTVSGSAGYTDAQAVSAVVAALSNSGNVAFTYSGGSISANTNGATTTTWAQSLGTSGYQRFPSGLIIQWGQFTLPSSATQTITFPLTFPNHVWSCVPSQGDSTSYGYPFGVDSLTTSGFTAVNSAGGINAGTGYYIAIGN